MDPHVLQAPDAIHAAYPDAAAGAASAHWSTRVTVLLSIVGCGLLMHLYRGLYQDAVIYTIQGLAHADPSRYAQDLLLRFGSQDQFSLFGWVYGVLIRHLGVEHAASLMTVCGQALFLFSAWRLTRCLLPKRLVPIAVGLLAVVPAVYGASSLLYVVEDFLTPRIFSEALVLAAIASWLNGTRTLALLLVAGALMVHPLMAMAGVVLLFWYSFGLEHRRLTSALLLLVVGGLVAVATLARGPPLLIDAAWLELVARNTYLFTQHWSAGDWGTSLAPLVTIVAAIPTSSAMLRRFLTATLLTALLGIALDWVGADRLHLVLIVQGQPWRWLWLSTCVSVLMLPWLGVELWKKGELGRATALLFGAECLFRGEVYTLPVLGLILGVLALSWYRPHLHVRLQRLVLMGAAVLFLIALINGVSTFFLSASHQFFPAEPARLPVWTKELRQATQRFLIVPAIMVALVVAAQTAPMRSIRWLCLALAAAGCIMVLPAAWTRWTIQEYGNEGYALFAGWRAQIPETAEVLCPEDPLLVYLLLERRSYLSIHQEGSGLFSRPAAMEILRREAMLRGFPDAVRADIAYPSRDNAAVGTLADFCSNAGSEVSFIVSSSDLKAPPLAEMPHNGRSRYSKWKLYGCSPTSVAGKRFSDPSSSRR